jgi:hypothetical protein
MRVATHPMSHSAVEAANRKSAATYQPTPQPGDPNYGAFRKQWMDAYIEAGGGYEEVQGEKHRKHVQQARKKAAKHAGFRGAVAPCLPAGRSTHQPQGHAHQAKPHAHVKPVKEAPPPADCACKLVALNLTCGHGRSAKDQLLMVVSEHALGDQINVTPSASGDCATRLVVRADAKQGYPVYGPRQSSFRVDQPAVGTHALDASFMPWKIAPLVTMVTAEADGCSRMVEVWSFPSRKTTFKIDVKKIREALHDITKLLPVDEKEELHKWQWEKKKLEQSISFEAQWAEDKGHLAYCEMALNGALEPAYAIEGRYPLYGVPVPAQLQEYIVAGLYVNVEAGVSLAAQCAWAYWPRPAEYKWKSAKLELGGSGSVELAAELMILKKALHAKAAGKTQLSLKGWAEKEDEEGLALGWQAEWKPLTVSAVLKVAWGLIEEEHNWPIFKARKTSDHKTPLLRHGSHATEEQAGHAAQGHGE